MSTKQTKQISPRSLLRMSLANFLKAVETANEADKPAFEEAAKVILQQIGTAPVKAPQPRRKVERNGHAAALRAHRSRVMAKLPGMRGKARAELKAKIAHYDELLQAA